MQQDLRWRQRFGHFGRAYAELAEAVSLAAERPLTKLEQQGVIQALEFTHELAWNLLKDYLTWQGVLGITGARDSTREAFKRALIQDGETWMAMINARNLTSHSYNRTTANAIFADIISRFFSAFGALNTGFEALARELDGRSQ